MASNSAKRRNIQKSSSSEETIHVSGVTPEYEQSSPHIFTSTEPSKPDKLPDYMDESQLSQETIKTIVMEIQRTPKNAEKRTEYFKMKYSQFAENYPILFKMACSDDFDFDKFNYMMKIRDQIATKQRTIEHASVEVGQKFYDMYMKK